jgi:putative protease
MSVHDTDGVVAAERLGVSRVVVARELSLDNIKSAVDNSPCEIETFLHGALCVCHSGQCLFSSMVGGRSGNRGECAQPCRLPFNNGKYILSLRDLSLAEHIPELIESGVASLKIEGRMKSPDYVYTVTSVYRRLLDEHRSADNDENARLRRAFSRGGFTDGYLTGKLDKNMTGIRSEEDKRQSREDAGREFLPMKRKVRAVVSMKLGAPSEMTITDGCKTVSVIGEIPSPAENSPLTPDSVKARLCKMGSTNLTLLPDDISLTLDEGINLPPSAINALRRSAAEAFESSRRELGEVNYAPKFDKNNNIKSLTTAKFYSDEAYLKALSSDPREISSLDISFLPLTSSADALSKANGVYLPPVYTDAERDEIVKLLENAKKHGIMYALVSNIGQIELVKSLGLAPIGDFRLNVTNGESAAVYRSMGVTHLILSPELTLPKARDIGGGLITYGRIPLMITERCFIGENFGCKNCNKAALIDRKGEKFPMMREFGHRNIIFNSLPTYMGDKADELRQYRLKSCHLLFTTERGDEINRIIKAHRCGEKLNDRVRRIGRR